MPICQSNGASDRHPIQSDNDIPHRGIGEARFGPLYQKRTLY
jgi:hypothetical protein